LFERGRFAAETRPCPSNGCGLPMCCREAQHHFSWPMMEPEDCCLIVIVAVVVQVVVVLVEAWPTIHRRNDIDETNDGGAVQVG